MRFLKLSKTAVCKYLGENRENRGFSKVFASLTAVSSVLTAVFSVLTAVSKTGVSAGFWKRINGLTFAVFENAKENRGLCEVNRGFFRKIFSVGDREKITPDSLRAVDLCIGLRFCWRMWKTFFFREREYKKENNNYFSEKTRIANYFSENGNDNQENLFT